MSIKYPESLRFVICNFSMFNYQSYHLPVGEVIPELREQLSEQNTVVLQAPPGAGKSTLVPIALLQEPFLNGKKILMLEPRRIAARSIAERMSQMIGEKVGQTIGYRIRFESKISEQTKIEVITEGILTRMLMDDNSLQEIGLIIFDEFHERSIHADLSLALSRESQEVLRPDLRLLIMSATLDVSTISERLNAPSIISDGALFPVEIIYTGDADVFSLADQTSMIIKRAISETDGDILVFLPGQGEIHQVESQLRNLREIQIFPLYGALPFSRQWAAIQPHKDGKRRIVLATSIAETSLTIEGIKTVVDCGYGRGLAYNPGSGLSRLHTYRISVDEADQRSGRAGRLGPGKCYRMWTAATHLKLKKHRIPEIESQDLTPMALNLSAWGCSDPRQMLWLSPPPQGTYYQSIDLLEQLGAIEEGKITTLGEQMNRLPCHPRIAHMLIEAKENGDLSLAADIAAILEEKDHLPQETGPDINYRVDWVRRKRSENASQPAFRRIDQIAQSYMSLFGEKTTTDDYDPYECGLLLSYAYPERIASAQAGNSGRYQLANGHVVKLPHRDELSAESWLVVAHMDARDHTGKVFLAAAMNPKDLASQVKEKDVVKWDNLQGKVIAETQMKVGSLVLSSKPLPDIDDEVLRQIVIEAIQKSEGSLLEWTDDVIQWQRRVELVRNHFPEFNLPMVDTSTLLSTISEWLSPYLIDIDTKAELQKLNLYEILSNSLTYDQQQHINELAPSKLQVPSGSMIRLEYRSLAESPILAVRIQELFGMSETPKICGGKVKILIHLLSPGFKPVQVTDDLHSFWSNTYFEVKKELKRRYPKHVWPDDPTTEPPTNRAKKRN